MSPLAWSIVMLAMVPVTGATARWVVRWRRRRQDLESLRRHQRARDALGRR